MIKVSVIVPIYNVEKQLAKCLDSLLNQTLKDIQKILVNDGSEDSSAEIAKKYVVKDPDEIRKSKVKNVIIILFLAIVIVLLILLSLK